MDAEKNSQEVLATINRIEDAILKNNVIFSEKWEVTHNHINYCSEDILPVVLIEILKISWA